MGLILKLKQLPIEVTGFPSVPLVTGDLAFYGGILPGH